MPGPPPQQHFQQQNQLHQQSHQQQPLSQQQSGQPGGSNGIDAGMTLAGVLHFLQTEWRRWERDRNEWEIERAEMRARIALLEGERRSADNLKLDLSRRVKMLEFALRQERAKQTASGNPNASSGPAAIPPSKLSSLQAEGADIKDGASTTSEGGSSSDEGASSTKPAVALANGTSVGSQAAPQTAPTGPAPIPAWKIGVAAAGRDPKSRQRSRDYLKQCLQEISYLTSPGALNPLPNRPIVLPPQQPASSANQQPSAAGPPSHSHALQPPQQQLQQLDPNSREFSQQPPPAPSQQQQGQQQQQEQQQPMLLSRPRKTLPEEPLTLPTSGIPPTIQAQQDLELAHDQEVRDKDAADARHAVELASDAQSQIHVPTAADHKDKDKDTEKDTSGSSGRDESKEQPDAETSQTQPHPEGEESPQEPLVPRTPPVGLVDDSADQSESILPKSVSNTVVSHLEPLPERQLRESERENEETKDQEETGPGSEDLSREEPGKTEDGEKVHQPTEPSASEEKPEERQPTTEGAGAEEPVATESDEAEATESSADDVKVMAESAQQRELEVEEAAPEKEEEEQHQPIKEAPEESEQSVGEEELHQGVDEHLEAEKGKEEHEDNEDNEDNEDVSNRLTAIFRPQDNDDWRAQLKAAGASIKPEVRAAEQPAKPPRMVHHQSGSDELNSVTMDDIDDDWADEKQLASTKGDNGSWVPRRALKRHLDCVRAVAFHPTELILATGSEDNVVKVWRLPSSTLDPSKSSSNDAEPIASYRGHTAAVTSLAVSATHIYSGSLDTSIRVWKVPPPSQDLYSVHDPSTCESTLVGHTDAVWDVALVGGKLVSASADGTIKVWDAEKEGTPLVGSWGYEGSGKEAEEKRPKKVPVSVATVGSEEKVVAVGWDNCVVKVYDLASGEELKQFECGESYNGESSTQINRIVTHPTLPLLITAHEDRFIRFFDLQSGVQTHVLPAHEDGVTSLAISPLLPDTLVSGGQDSSTRVWDLSSHELVQEFTLHRRNKDQGVLDVALHQSVTDGDKKVLATAGADGSVRVLCWVEPGSSGGSSSSRERS